MQPLGIPICTCYKTEKKLATAKMTTFLWYRCPAGLVGGLGHDLMCSQFLDH